jgi:RNA polymerase sigma factor (sigma-70 family)
MDREAAVYAPLRACQTRPQLEVVALLLRMSDMEIQSPPDASTTRDAHALYARCCSANPQVCSDAFQELGAFLLRVALARFKDRPYLSHLAEDCAQQALEIAWRKLQDGRGPDRAEWFLTWCAGIVIHRIQDELRRTARARLDSLDELAEDGATQLPAHPPAEDGGDLSFATATDRDRFVALIENHPRLNSEAKLVLLHGYLLEQDDQELAGLLGKSRATVRVLRHRAIKQLRSDAHFMAQVTALTHAEPARAGAPGRVRSY